TTLSKSIPSILVSGIAPPRASWPHASAGCANGGKGGKGASFLYRCGVALDGVDATVETEGRNRAKGTPGRVDLWAEWCGPCRTLGPILEKVIGETDGKVVLAKVDVDNNRQIAEAFRVQSIPAVYALKDGKVVDGFIGAQGEDFVRSWVAK